MASFWSNFLASDGLLLFVSWLIASAITLVLLAFEEDEDGDSADR